MNKTLLITFGCSWTQGVGVGYTVGMNRDQYKKIAWDTRLCDINSYRGILSRQLNIDNLNFAQGGNSNQAQFYAAKKYFASKHFLNYQKNYKKIIVLHAITSTARNFFFDLETHSSCHVKYDLDDKFSKFMVKHSYDHNFEVTQLNIEMRFWNVFYRSLGIKNIWVDTFNHHDYESDIDNLVDGRPQRDLLSQLCIKNNAQLPDKKTYHLSSWVDDDNRIADLVKIGMLNPISYHPTQAAHQQIADLLEPKLKSLF